ncbi:MAG TPA: magnesium-translocating P-type ATPase [Dehalococcoidia bacterium]|nr:magnesium-translocating P-type ATPase [Dehalococcoidia bacterium]
MLQTTAQGLTSEEARQRLDRYGPNLVKPKKRYDFITLLWAQFKSPIILILAFAAVLSFFLHDQSTAIIVLVIIIVSGLLGFWQEYGAINAVKKLVSLVQVKATVLRDGNSVELPIENIVPGDIVILRAGDVIPGDCFLLESQDLFADEAVLTGETYPAEKAAGMLQADISLKDRRNTLFMGTHVISGSARAVVVNTGLQTEFGKIAQRLELRPPETDFEHGVRRFGYLLMEVTLVLVIAIFAINVYLARPILDSLLFSLALAVGLTPQLLPAIIGVNLAQGAKRMAQHKVIVKRLASIENFGSMNVLCSDKTGTLTEGKVQLHSAQDVEGRESEKVLLYAYLNATYETGYINPIDEAVRTYRKFDISAYKKLDEIPYDFVRKRISILVSTGDTPHILTKGALPNVLAVCSSAEMPDNTVVALTSVQQKVQKRFEELSREGFRILGMAYRPMKADSITREDEAGMVFLGFLVFFDPPKVGIVETLNRLKKLGISPKIITGDNQLVAESIAKQVGLATKTILAGRDLHQMSDEALLQQVNSVDVFAEVEPNHKERIILALMKTGNVVGYLGDGINDASALHAADIGISVDSAVDVAKEAADIVLLDKDLNVLVQGVEQGRQTFANTLKYVFMATSANFGNMFSMAGASTFLTFLPLLPKQILLTNLMTDLPEMTIATDSVDKELIDQPRRWNMGFIRNFMITFGILSSVFDYLTFAVLLFVLHAGSGLFRTGWFVESVISASLVVLVIRSRRLFFKSRPSRYLLMTTLIIAALALVVPFTPLGAVFGFIKLPLSFILLMLAIVALYIIAAELAKRVFYRYASF